MKLSSLFTLVLQFVIIYQFGNLFKAVLCNKTKEEPQADFNLQHEVHEAKNLIDALSFRLHLNQQSLAVHEERLRQESSVLQSQSLVMENQIKELKKLKHFLNEMTGKKASICETFYSDVDFRMAQPIKIDTKGSALPKHSTVTLQGIICTPARISSTNTIRKYSFRGKYMFVVRIFTNVFFRLKTIHVTIMLQNQ